MPGLSGFDVLRELRANADLVATPVIFLSGASETEDKVRGLDLGAVDYVTKPFDAFELRARVRSALRTKQFQDTATRAEEKFKALNQDLERRVAERTASAEDLLRQKNAFIHQLSHDLKTPLTPLVALLPLVREHLADAKDQRMLDLCFENVGYMKNLVEKTLRLAELNAAQCGPAGESSRASLTKESHPDTGA